MHEDASRISLRRKADAVRAFRCKNLIVVLENPYDWRNIGSVVRNVNALGAEKVYVIDGAGKLPDDWQAMQSHKKLLDISASAVKWRFVKRFDSTEACVNHLEGERLRVGRYVASHQGQSQRHPRHCRFHALQKAGCLVWERAIRDQQRSALCVSIPMYGIIESLNLATSTGIALYEITKQRRAFQMAKQAMKEGNVQALA